MAAEVVLVDTSVWILALRLKQHIHARARIGELLGTNSIAIIPLIYVELLGGVNSETEFQRLKSRLGSLKHIQIVKHDWEETAQNAFKLRRKGITVPYIDIIIGTVAAINKITLLTADNHFSMIAKEIDLKVEYLPDSPV